MNGGQIWARIGALVSCAVYLQPQEPLLLFEVWKRGIESRAALWVILLFRDGLWG